MLQPRAGTARIGLHGEEGWWRATAIGQPHNAGRDNEDDNRKPGNAGRRGRRQCRRRHAGLQRCVRQTPFAGVAGYMLFEVRAMLRQQPLREQQRARD